MIVIYEILVILIVAGTGVFLGIAQMTFVTILRMTWYEDRKWYVAIFGGIINLVCFAPAICVLINVINSFSFEYDYTSYSKIGFCIGYFGTCIFSIFYVFLNRDGK